MHLEEGLFNINNSKLGEKGCIMGISDSSWDMTKNGMHIISRKVSRAKRIFTVITSIPFNREYIVQPVTRLVLQANDLVIPSSLTCLRVEIFGISVSPLNH